MKSSLTPETAARTVRVESFVAQMERSERAALGDAIERFDMAELERKAITARIQQARKEAGLSQPEMAEALHTHERTYQNYESQKHPRVPWGLLGEIAEVTGTSTAWLIHGVGEKTPDVLGTFNGVPDDLRKQLDRIETTQKAILANQKRLLKLGDQVAALDDFVKQDVQPALERVETELHRVEPAA